MEHQTGPILIDLDQYTWEEQLNKVGGWLGNTLMAQLDFRQQVADTIPMIQEPHIRSALVGIENRALDHIRKVYELFQIIQRNPYYFTNYGAYAIAQFKETIGKIEGMLGGVPGDWQMLHQLVLSNMNALAAFAVAEQFGLLLGLPEIATVALPVVHQKETDQLVLKEYMLEMASVSIIYGKSI